jgi:hypothetical protein
MRKLKTPEEITGDTFDPYKGVLFTQSQVFEFIRSAQRDALECAAEKIQFEIDGSGDSSATPGLMDGKQSILNLLPKES